MLRQVFICGIDEREKFRSQQITHIISIANPGAVFEKPSWFGGEHIQLWFGDVASEADAERCHTKAPTAQDVQEAIAFFRKSYVHPRFKILVSCDYGASRSPALAYVLLADKYGAGHEPEAFQHVMSIRPTAVPNSLVIRLGDAALDRHGDLLKPLKEFYFELNKEISKHGG